MLGEVSLPTQVQHVNVVLHLLPLLLLMQLLMLLQLLLMILRMLLHQLLYYPCLISINASEHGNYRTTASDN